MSEINRLDFTPNKLIDFEKLSKITKVSEDTFCKHTFSSLLKVFSINNDVGRARFMLGVIRDNLYYCPLCLDEHRYYRLIWQLNGVSICPEHNIYLLNKCAKCKKEINYNTIKKINICPYCGNTLHNISSYTVIKGDVSDQVWLYNAWNSLLNLQSVNVKPNDVALKLIFLLNNKKDYFIRELVSKELSNSKILSTLLQHARESLSHTRVIHISFILDILSKMNVDINDFFSIVLPVTFIDSIIKKKQTIKDSKACMAHWCANFNMQGLLIKTGTSVKKKNNEMKMHYYLICPECGCEYALDEKGNMVERTYFIKGYNLVKKYISEEIGLKELAASSDLSVDKLKRCIAYFSTRNISEFCTISMKNEIDECLLDKFTAALENECNIKEVEHWEYWRNYNHYLMHRYHKKVMSTEIKVIKTRGKRIDINLNIKKVYDILEHMLVNDIDITLGALCDRLGIVPETIRQWKCNVIIAEFKEIQKDTRKKLNKENTIEKAHAFILNNADKTININDLYKHLNKSRTALWRDYPELTKLLANLVKKHNRKINEF